MLRLLLAFILVGLTVYALVDCARTAGAQTRGLPKPVWLIVILLVPAIGPISWIIFGRGPLLQEPEPRHPTLAPDDDPIFLKQISEQRRLQEWEKDLKRREEKQRQSGTSETQPPDDNPPSSAGAPA